MLLRSWCSLICLGVYLCLFCRPFGCKSTLVWREFIESLQIVAVPKVKLKVLGGVFDINQIIHEVASCAWLEKVLLLAEQIVWVQVWYRKCEQMCRNSMLLHCQLNVLPILQIQVEAGMGWMKEGMKSTYRASASSDDAVKGQGIWNTKRHPPRASRGLGIHGGLANGLGLLIPENGSSSRVDMRGTTVCEGVDHVGW